MYIEPENFSRQMELVIASPVHRIEGETMEEYRIRRKKKNYFSKLIKQGLPIIEQPKNQI